MLLAIDIGNSNIVFGIHHRKNWIHHWREETQLQKPAEAYEMSLSEYLLENNLSSRDIREVVISSVVPGLTPSFTNLVKSVFGLDPLVIGPSIYHFLPLQVPNPHEMGTDLVANAMAAFHHFRQVCLVVDFGTALTCTTTGSDGAIRGVAIAPGIKTAMKALSGNTAKLPEIPLKLPESVIGKDTVHAMQAGILHGYIGLVQSLIAETKKEPAGNCKTAATGGLSEVLTPLKGHFDHIDPLLTLNGLRIIKGHVK